MTVLPILERELRLRARQRGNYWGRFGIALAGVVVGLPPLLFSGVSNNPASVGRGVFIGIVGAAFLLCCAACLVTADAVSAERRQGTLGLLLLTRVKAFDVLIGKFATGGLTCLFALASLLPVLMIPVLAGGVTGGEVFRKGLVLLDLMFLALSAGLWASARTDDRLKAARSALLTVFLLVLAPVLPGWLSFWRELSLLSPLGALGSAADTAYRVTPGSYWLSLALVQVIAWTLLSSAGAGLRCSREGLGVVGVRTLLPGIQEAAPPVSTPKPRSHSLAAANEPTALHWLLGRQRGWRLLFWLAAVLSFFQFAFYGVFARFAAPRSIGLHFGIASALSLVIGGIGGALIAWAASRYFVESRRTGEFELLMTTPLGRESIVSAQWAVLKRWLRWPVVLMLAPILLQTFSILAMSGFSPGPAWKLNYAASMLIRAINTVAGVGALCWLGLWFGSRGRGQAQVILWTVGLARGVPFLLWLGWYLLSNLLVPVLGRPTTMAFWLLTSLAPQVLFLALSLGWIRLARRQLRLDLSGAEPLPLRQEFTGAITRAAARIRTARHWTPG